MPKINIAGINKAKLLQALYHQASVPKNCQAEMIFIEKDSPHRITLEHAQACLTEHVAKKQKIDYLNGKYIKIDFLKDEIDSALYDTFNGIGLVAKTVALFRAGKEGEIFDKPPKTHLDDAIKINASSEEEFNFLQQMAGSIRAPRPVLFGSEADTDDLQRMLSDFAPMVVNTAEPISKTRANEECKEPPIAEQEKRVKAYVDTVNKNFAGKAFSASELSEFSAVTGIPIPDFDTSASAGIADKSSTVKSRDESLQAFREQRAQAAKFVKPLAKKFNKSVKQVEKQAEAYKQKEALKAEQAARAQEKAQAEKEAWEKAAPEREKQAIKATLEHTQERVKATNDELLTHKTSWGVMSEQIEALLLDSAKNIEKIIKIQKAYEGPGEFPFQRQAEKLINHQVFNEALSHTYNKFKEKLGQKHIENLAKKEAFDKLISEIIPEIEKEILAEKLQEAKSLMEPLEKLCAECQAFSNFFLKQQKSFSTLMKRLKEQTNEENEFLQRASEAVDKNPEDNNEVLRNLALKKEAKQKEKEADMARKEALVLQRKKEKDEWEARRAEFLKTKQVTDQNGALSALMEPKSPSMIHQYQNGSSASTSSSSSSQNDRKTLIFRSQIKQLLDKLEVLVRGGFEKNTSQMKPSYITLMIERNALLGSCARLMDRFKDLQGQYLFPISMARHFRNVIFHGFDLIPLMDKNNLNKAIDINAEIRTMALALIYYIRSEPKPITCQKVLLQGFKSDLFIAIMTHEISEPSKEVCLQQLALGKTELKEYKADGTSSPDLKKMAMGFTQARLGTYVSHLKHDFKSTMKPQVYQDEVKPFEWYIEKGQAFRHVETLQTIEGTGPSAVAAAARL